MANWIDDTFLQIFEPDILAEGDVSDYSVEIGLAQADVLEIILSEWWETTITQRFSRYDATWTFDESLLDTEKLKKMVAFRTFGFYIMPKLSTFRDVEDKFGRKRLYYREEFSSEWKRVFKQAIYDFNEDSQFSQWERTEVMGVRVLRA